MFTYPRGQANLPNQPTTSHLLGADIWFRDIGCCTSDETGAYCKAEYDTKKKQMEEQLKAASCGKCEDCPASKVAKATGEPSADCAMVKSKGFCGHPMGVAMCPVKCGKCSTATTTDLITKDEICRNHRYSQWWGQLGCASATELITKEQICRDPRWKRSGWWKVLGCK